MLCYFNRSQLVATFFVAWGPVHIGVSSVYYSGTDGVSHVVDIWLIVGVVELSDHTMCFRNRRQTDEMF